MTEQQRDAHRAAGQRPVRRGPAPTGGPSTTRGPTSAERDGPAITVKDLNAYYGDNHAIKDVTIDYAPNEVTAMIGPSGCGKSTLVRCLNRMHEEIPGARAEGRVTARRRRHLRRGVDVVAVRRAIGMVFQKPNPFPTMSIFDNVAAGLKLTGVKGDNLKRARREVAARRRPVGRGQGPARASRASASPAASSSACASPARSPSSPR